MRSLATLLTIPALLLALASTAGALALETGDVLAAATRPDGGARIFRIAPSGDEVATGASLDGGALAIDAQRRVWTSSSQGIVRVDPGTGDVTVVSPYGTLTSATDIALDDAGDLLVADGAAGTIVRVDAATGAQTLAATGGDFSFPTGITIEDDGDLLVADSSQDAIFRVDPATGTRQVVSAGGSLEGPIGIALDDRGRIVATSQDAIVRIDAGTGAQSILSSGGGLDAPAYTVVGRGGDIYATNLNGADILRVDPTTGDQTFLVPDEEIDSSAGLAVVPVPEPATALLVASGLAGLVAARRA